MVPHIMLALPRSHLHQSSWFTAPPFDQTTGERSCWIVEVTSKEVLDQKRALPPRGRDVLVQEDVDFGTVTDTLLWYKFSPLSGIRVKTKLPKRRRRIFESLQKPSQKPKVIHAYNLYRNLASLVKNYQGSIEQLRSIQRATSRIAE